ncbi:MAG: RNA methyltransferase [Candidatus Omnitrophota bacterium]
MGKFTKTQIRELRELVREKKARDEKDLFVAEGIKIVEDMLMKEHVPVSVVIASDFANKPEGKSLLEKLQEAAVPVSDTSSADIEKLSSLKNSQGILAVMKKSSVEERVQPSEQSILVLCDGIQDPGNLGAIIRTSIAFGVDGILLSGDTVDIYNPKVVRASSGTVLDIPVRVSDMAEINSLQKEGYRLLVSMVGDAGSSDVIGACKYEGPLIIAFGSEGQGVSRELSESADGFFHIPIREDIESLNVTAAAAITLFVLSRSKS